MPGLPGPQGIQGIQGSLWYSGSGVPSAAAHRVGDWYLNVANGDVYEKTGEATWTVRDNLTGPQGLQGIQGIQGLKGDQGIQGIQGIQGVQGDKGWSPILAVVTDGTRRVLQVIDWTGGAGTKPATGSYIGPTGLVASIASAVDIRGPAGPTASANSIDNTMLADMAVNTIKGRVTAGTGDPEDLTGAQAAGIMPVVRYDVAQSLSATQQKQARDNLGLKWRPIHEIIVDAVNLAEAIVSIPADVDILRVSGAIFATNNAANDLAARISLDNGASFPFAADDYLSGLLVNIGTTVSASGNTPISYMRLSGSHLITGAVPLFVSALIMPGSPSHQPSFFSQSAAYNFGGASGYVNGMFNGFYRTTGRATHLKFLLSAGAAFGSKTRILIEGR
jgi:hypothetical protein